MVIQFGSILAVLVLYYQKLNPFDTRKSPKKRKQTLQLWSKVIVGVIPAAIIGLLLDDIIEGYLSANFVIAVALIAYGIIFILVEKNPRQEDVYKRQRLGIDIVHAGVQDATTFKSSVLYDRILCDVPCSGYGVLSRKPDIKLHMAPEDMDTLIPLQYSILNNVCQYVKVGGVLVYSTCTMNKKENEKQIEKFLRAHEEFSLVDEKTIFSDTRQDGFYMAKLVRK